MVSSFNLSSSRPAAIQFHGIELFLRGGGACIRIPLSTDICITRFLHLLSNKKFNYPPGNKHIPPCENVSCQERCQQKTSFSATCWISPGHHTTVTNAPQSKGGICRDHVGCLYHGADTGTVTKTHGIQRLTEIKTMT